MRFANPILRSSFAKNIVLLALGTTALTACSSESDRFMYPLFSSSGGSSGGYVSPQQTASNDDYVSPAPRGGVERAPVAPVETASAPSGSANAGNSPVYMGPQNGQTSQVASAQSQTYNAQTAGAQTYTAPTASVASQPVAAASQPVATQAAGTSVKVESGDTLYGIARRHNVSAAELQAANNISDPSRIRIGQTLILPGGASAGSTMVASSQPAATTTSSASPQPYQQPEQTASAKTQQTGGEHTVASGETLAAIGRQYNVSANTLMTANNISDPTRLRVGQKLTIPGEASGGNIQLAQGEQPLRAPAAQPTIIAQAPQATAPQAPQQVATLTETSGKGDRLQSMEATHNPKQPMQYQSPSSAAVSPSQTAQTAEAKQDDPVQTASLQPQTLEKAATEARELSFRWPVRGRVIAAFGKQASGQQNDGINLSVPEGASVKSAEDGEVVYAGNEVKGYGNLVLVKHADNWVSAYAHNSELLVQQGDSVKRGQVIARAGQTGSVTSPQLHFELRKGATPVDPMPHLASLQ